MEDKKAVSPYERQNKFNDLMDHLMKNKEWTLKNAIKLSPYLKSFQELLAFANENLHFIEQAKERLEKFKESSKKRVLPDLLWEEKLFKKLKWFYENEILFTIPLINFEIGVDE